MNAPQFSFRSLAFVLSAGMLCGVKLAGQTVFNVNNLAPIVSTGAYVSITAPDTLFQTDGPVSGGITPRTIDTNIYFDSPGPSFGASNPGFIFNGMIYGTPISPNTTIPISYSFNLSRNAYVGSAVVWTLVFYDNVNTTPIVIGSGTLSGTGAATANFSGSGYYNFVSGVSATFSAAIELSYTTGQAMGNPQVSVLMVDSGFGGQGITIGSAAGAVPEPSTYAMLMGAATLGVAFWRRRNVGRLPSHNAACPS